MLAVASLAAGVVTALLTPPSHAVVGDALPDPGSLAGADLLDSVVDTATGGAAQSPDSTRFRGSEEVR